jgi:calcineurin-like phosphoesterase family protein
MRVQQPVRDRNMSLWQSAVRQTLINRADLSDNEKKQGEYGISLHAQSEQNHRPLPAPVLPAPDASKMGPIANIATASKDAFDALQAHQNGDGTAATLFSTMHDFIMKYSTWDISGWVQCGWYYMKYYVLAHLPPSYNDWQAHAPADINFGVIDYVLPKNSRVLIIGDWGTHMPDNAALLRQALKQFNPDVIIHLGDVYYSGTVEECTANVLEVLDKIIADVQPRKRPPFFTIPGNHDYYSGGSGFYHTIGKVNSGVVDCTQQASYFCLRTEDSKWQFLGMDTGYGDRNPVEQQAPSLQVHEGAWHQDKLENFAGSTILLSHHQLLSAKEQLNKGLRPYLNENLYGMFSKYFDRITAWYWGHEHNFIVFDNNLSIHPGDPALKRGRLVGCSAYEETVDEDPFKINYPQARFIPNMPRLGLSPYKTDLQRFYNHAFAILDVAPEKITATYYEYPSWGADNAPQQEPPVGPHHLYKEDLLPAR